MNQPNVFNAKNLSTILVITLIVVVLGLALSFIQTPKYKASAKLLVVFSQENMSPYTSAQTSNYIAGILEEVVYSNSFIDNIFKTSFALKDTLGFNQEKRLKNWSKMVKTNVQENKGIILVDVYHTSKDQADQFAQAISYVLTTNHATYHGSGENVVVKIISRPQSSDKWATPNILQNFLISLVAGVFLGLTFVMIFPQQQLLSFATRRKSARQDEIIDTATPVNKSTESNQAQTPNNYYRW